MCKSFGLGPVSGSSIVPSAAKSVFNGGSLILKFKSEGDGGEDCGVINGGGLSRRLVVSFERASNVESREQR